MTASVAARSRAIGFSQNAGTRSSAARWSNVAWAGVAAAMTTASMPASNNASGLSAHRAPTASATPAARFPSASVTVSVFTRGFLLNSRAWRAPIRPVPTKPTCIYAPLSLCPQPSVAAWERSHGNVPVSIILRADMSSTRAKGRAAIARRTRDRTSRPPTIIDVANLAGVSKSAVSRVIRGESSVSPSSRTAVIAAAEELGYRANAVARSLVQRRTYNVGVMVSDLHNIFFAEVLDGLYAAAAERGYRALITTGNRDPFAEERALEQLLELRADGVVLAGARLSADVIAAVARLVPIALVGSDLRLRDVDVVVDDDFHGATLAVDHLVKLGHRDIALIDGGQGAGAAQRRAGYETAMQRARLATHARVEPGDFTEEGGYEGARRLLRRPPTAIFASNDQSAVGALNAIEEAGLSVPGDISLIGYDNTALAALRHISLTTIHQPRRQIGEMAMTAVLRRIEHPGAKAQRHVLAPRLVLRATTGKPARGLKRRR